MVDQRSRPRFRGDHGRSGCLIVHDGCAPRPAALNRAGLHGRTRSGSAKPTPPSSPSCRSPDRTWWTRCCERRYAVDARRSPSSAGAAAAALLGLTVLTRSRADQGDSPDVMRYSYGAGPSQFAELRSARGLCTDTGRGDRPRRFLGARFRRRSSAVPWRPSG